MLVVPLYILWLFLYEAPLKDRMKNFETFISDESAFTTKLRAAVQQKDDIWISPRFHYASLCILLLLGLSSTLVPIRHVPSISNVGVLMNKINRLDSSSLLAMHYIRELMWGDELLTMSRKSLNTNLNMLLYDIETVSAQFHPTFSQISSEMSHSMVEMEYRQDLSAPTRTFGSSAPRSADPTSRCFWTQFASPPRRPCAMRPPCLRLPREGLTTS